MKYTKVISAKVPDDIVDAVDAMVHAGLFRSRSAAVEHLLRTALAVLRNTDQTVDTVIGKSNAQKVASALSNLVASGRYDKGQRLLEAINTSPLASYAAELDVVKMAKTLLESDNT